MNISQRIKEVPYSAIRKLTPFADKAKADGKKVYHLNIGAPDTKTPDEFFDAIKNTNLKTLDYAPSKGLKSLMEKTCEYYKARGADFDPNKDIIITTGASEALVFALIAVSELGQKILTSNPFYSNYYTIFRQCGLNPVTFDTKVEDGYRLPDYETIKNAVTEDTAAILISNPSNPTGTVYTEEELRRIVRVAKEKDLFIIADEVYSEFIFDGKTFMSFASIEGIEDRLIILDSISKRFGACGARIGSLICKNQELMTEVIKLATGRLAVSTIDQIGATALYNVDESYFKEVNEEYEKRRNLIYEELKKIEGVKVYKPEGAFYIMPDLPIKDADDFAMWLLTEFDVDGETIMIAPADGFYHDSNEGKSKVRLAYVINQKDLKRAIEILGIALKEYRKLTNQ
ncbi:pyridoxal phosphate-dependent aminotransferase [Anaerosphaera multitolerans]|uniref:Aminotransferase n=2 Tax=Anaerosphaera multitolerans TaxID=2487351 RepID=A0A437S9T0_9FIRM|nr:pyridoxal phosphate-dependent aminotransferase [Anaerosphaera multitolerans]RVU55879.1 pyridoxal phosphate-dependent aminotransferase [Anaerosphaera multitolerans]